MECGACGTQNREGRKFCTQCGATLSLACPSCGEPNEGGSRFCGECGNALGDVSGTAGADERQPDPATERRLVSVLFADMVGFTTLSERLDSEDVRALLTRYFDRATEIVGRYGGTVEKFIGDAVMAVWGTPAIREDDAERAVRAALDLVDAARAIGAEVAAPHLELRAGVTTGEGTVTIGAQNQGMVAGDLVNTAARLQSVAEPGAVLVGESTFQAAKSAIDFEDAGSHALKGKEEPVHAWRALRIAAGPSVARSDVLDPPFVGRNEEFRLVKDLFHLTERERTARLLCVVGIGGIGKSRVGLEFLKYIDGLIDDIFWHHGRCPSYGDGIAFWALAEMVRMRARIAETDDDETARGKLTKALATYVGEEEHRLWIEPKLQQLLGLGDVAEHQRDELFAAWRSFFEHIADLGPTVLVFEDVQWADPGLVRFIEHLMEWAARRPIFVIVLARPEIEERHSNLGTGRHSTTLHLEPLSDEAMSVLLRQLIVDATDPLVASVVERAEGVPLYAIETVRALVDREVLRRLEDGRLEQVTEMADLDIPDSLHALIAARLDVLSAEDRALVQQASVLGKSFTLDGLVAIRGLERDAVETQLRTLVRREFIAFDADPRSPERGQYGFVQSLIREVAYQTLSKRDRRALHLSAAHHFESLHDDALAAAVAVHYLEARRASSEGPESRALGARARDWLVAAADRSASLGSHDAALGYLEQAIDIEESEPARAELHLHAGKAATAAALEHAAERHLSEAIAWYESHDDLEGVAEARTSLAAMMLNIGSRVADAIEALRPLTELQVPSELEESLVQAAAVLARAHMLGSEPLLSLPWADAALRLSEASNDTRTVADVLITKGCALADVGRTQEGMILVRGGMALATAGGFLLEELRGAMNLSMSLMRSDPREGMEIAIIGYERARDLGLRADQTLLVHNAGECGMECADLDWFERTLTELESQSMPDELLWLTMLSRALLFALRGKEVEARQLLETNAALHGGIPDAQGESWNVAAIVELASGALQACCELAFTKQMNEAISENRYEALTAGAHAAAWLRDRERLDRCIAALRALPLMGPSVEPFIRSFQATSALLATPDDREALRASATALSDIRHTSARFQLALHAIDVIHALGPDHPTSAELADEARGVLERMGSPSFLDRLNDAMKSATPAAAETQP